MKLIITIETDDSDKVTVSGLASDEPPLPEPPSELPLREPAQGQCPVHRVAWKVVPAGVSKSTGKPYSEFQACPERGCNERPRR